MAKSAGSFKVDSWDEKPYVEAEGKKMTLAIVGQSFSGDVEGKGDARWLMSYRADGTAHFVGLQRVDGTVGGRKGTFVMETSGDFDGETARWKGTIIDGCGGGELAGLRGSGDFAAPMGSMATFELELETT